MLKEFSINPNKFLSKGVVGYYHQDYLGYGQLGNPNFLNTLKNTYETETIESLTSARDMVINILMDDIPEVMERTDMSSCVCVCVPRSKAMVSYATTQLMFLEAVIIAIKNIPGVVDRVNIIRVENTFTTHMRQATYRGKFYGNDGDDPYPGITKATCVIMDERIRGQDIILIDDIYTKYVNVDEDCIQALFDYGAKRVVFYAIACTRRK